MSTTAICCIVEVAERNAADEFTVDERVDGRGNQSFVHLKWARVELGLRRFPFRMEGKIVMS